MSGCRSEAGRLFQILGPATEKVLSPSRVFVLGTVRTLTRAERSWGIWSLRSVWGGELGFVWVLASFVRVWELASK